MSDEQIYELYENNIKNTVTIDARRYQELEKIEKNYFKIIDIIKAEDNTCKAVLDIIRLITEF